MRVLIALASAKASPGVTTLALALAAVWPTSSRVVLAETDPAGGDLAAWLELPPRPGLVSLAAAARRTPTPAVVLEHTQPLTGGLEVLAAPAGAEPTRAALGMLPAELAARLDAEDGLLVLADCGRLDPGSPALTLAAQARLVVLLARPQAAELGHLVGLLGWLRARVHGHTGLVLAGEGHWPPGAVAAAVGTPVVGVVPRDARGVARLTGASRHPRRVGRLALLHAAADLAATLTQLARTPAPAGRAATPRSPTGPTDRPPQQQAPGNEGRRGMW
jgi:hypothetical protein